MKVKALHPILSNEKSYLTAKAASGQTKLNVLNASTFAQNDFVVIGISGEKGTEIKKIASITGNEITLTANLVTTHGENTVVNIIDYDQAELWKATSENGTYAKVNGTIINLAIDEEYTLLSDSSAVSTDHFKIKYYNTQTTTYSEFSDSIPYTGFARYALSSIQDHTLEEAKDTKEQTITRDMITEWTNQWKDFVASEIAESNEKYFLVYRTYALAVGTQEYLLLGSWRKIQKIEVNLSGGDFYRAIWEDIEDDNPDYVYSASDPRYYLNAGYLGFRPTPTAVGTAKVWQEEMPADLTEDGDELVAPLRYYLDNLYDYLEYKVQKQLRKSNEADSAWTKFQNGVDRIIEQINSRVLDQNRGVKESTNEFFIP